MFVSIDTETTGFAPYSQIIEIGIVQLDNRFQLINEWDTLIQPFRKSQPEAFLTHGIAPEDLTSAPRFVDVAPEITDKLQGNIILGHNPTFDIRALHEEYRRVGATFDSDAIDSQTYWPGTLDVACQNANITRGYRTMSSYATSHREKLLESDIIDNPWKWEHSKPHRALEDARAVAALFRRSYQIGEIPPQVTHRVDTCVIKPAKAGYLPYRPGLPKTEITEQQAAWFNSVTRDDLSKIKSFGTPASQNLILELKGTWKAGHRVIIPKIGKTRAERLLLASAPETQQTPREQKNPAPRIRSQQPSAPVIQRPTRRSGLRGTLRGRRRRQHGY